MVKNVEGLELELCLCLLANVDCLEQAELSVKELRTMESSYTRVSEAVESSRLAPRAGGRAQCIQRDAIGRLIPIPRNLRISRPGTGLNATYYVWEPRTLVNGGRTIAEPRSPRQSARDVRGRIQQRAAHNGMLHGAGTELLLPTFAPGPLACFDRYE